MKKKTLLEGDKILLNYKIFSITYYLTEIVMKSNSDPIGILFRSYSDPMEILLKSFLNIFCRKNTVILYFQRILPNDAFK